MWFYSLSSLLKSIPVLERGPQTDTARLCHAEGGTDSLILNVLNHISHLAQKCSTRSKWKCKVQDKHCVSNTELPHQPWTALWGTWKWCWAQPSTGCSAPCRTRLFVHSIFMAQQQETLNTANVFSWHGGKHKSINHHLPTAQNTGNEWCLGVTGCNGFSLILLPSVTCCSAPGKQQPIIQLCCVTSLITNTQVPAEQTAAMLSSPIPPSNNRWCDHRGVLWDLRGPATKNLEFQIKIMYK